MNDLEKIDDQVEEAIGNLYGALYQFRMLKEYEKEYNVICTLQSMLSKDKLELLKKYGNEISF